MKKFLPFFLLAAGVTVLLVALNQQKPPMESPAIGAPSMPLSFSKQPPEQELWIPVLVYHHIGIAPGNLKSGDKSLFIEETWLEKHLEYLKEHNFHTIHFSDLTAYFEKETPLPANPVIINFDDGWATTATVALPLLQKYGMTATAFIVANYPKEHGDNGRGYMSWDQIKILRDSGIEIGSHTLRHPMLTKVKNAQDEITRSKKILEDKLGITVTTFAYPYGNYNEKIEQMVKNAGYTTGRSFTTGNGISTKNLFHIPVVRVYANVGLDRWKKQLYKNGAPD